MRLDHQRELLLSDLHKLTSIERQHTLEFYVDANAEKISGDGFEKIKIKSVPQTKLTKFDFLNIITQNVY